MNNIETSSPILTIYLSSTEKRPPYFSYFVSQLHSLVHRDLSEVEKRKWKRYRVGNFVTKKIQKRSKICGSRPRMRCSFQK